MRTKKQITVQINKLETLLKKLNKEHSKLSQYEMLGQEGSVLRKKINITDGKIKALKWLLDDEKDISNNS
jgi:hypothetical protein